MQNHLYISFYLCYDVICFEGRLCDGTEKNTLMKYLFCLALALFAGLLMTRVLKKLRLPAVTAYLIAGILIGPFALGMLGIEGLGFRNADEVSQFSILSDVALGFIAFGIGNEFRLTQLKQTGKQATVIAIVQACAAALLVDGALIAFHFLQPEKLSLGAALVLGAIASATAPAATLMVVKQYKAKGKLTDLLLPIVALDDAVGLIIFSVSFGIAKALMNGAIDLIAIIVNPMIEIIASLILGALMGAIMTVSEKWFHSRSKRMSLSITYVFLTIGISMLNFEFGAVHLSFSPLLTCMMMGTVFCNLCDFSKELMERTDGWTSPLFILFFVLSGASLNLLVFSDIVVVSIGIIYVIFRAGGKYLGAYSSAGLVNCDKPIKNYLGITLFPQGGVALGMSLLAAQQLGADGSLIRNITLFAVLIYEIVGPVLTKISLTRSGDIIPEERKSSRIHNDHVKTHR